LRIRARNKKSAEKRQQQQGKHFFLPYGNGNSVESIHRVSYIGRKDTEKFYLKTRIIFYIKQKYFLIQINISKFLIPL